MSTSAQLHLGDCQLGSLKSASAGGHPPDNDKCHKFLPFMLVCQGELLNIYQHNHVSVSETWVLKEQTQSLGESSASGADRYLLLSEKNTLYFLWCFKFSVSH